MGLGCAGMYVVFCLLMRFITGTWKWFWVPGFYMMLWCAAMFLDIWDYHGAITGGSGKWTGRFFSEILFEGTSSLIIAVGGGFTLVAAIVWRLIKEIQRGSVNHARQLWTSIQSGGAVARRNIRHA